jgi:hypothetical protein
MPATSTDRLNGITTSLAVKAPVKAVTTANITLSGLTQLNIIPAGTTLSEGDRVFVRVQTDAEDNGIYNASSSDWTRAKDFDGNRDVVKGTLIISPLSDSQAGVYQITSDDPIVIGTSDIDSELLENPEISDTPVAQVTSRVKPTGFTYVTGTVFDCPGPGRAAHDFDAEQQFLALYGSETGIGDFWVDPINGSDGNPGSLNSPYATLGFAVLSTSSSGLGTVWLKPGVYTERFDVRASDNLVSGGTSARAIRIKAWGGPGTVIFRAPGQQPGEMTWVLTGGTSLYEATPSGGQLVEHIVAHIDDREIPIQYYASTVAADASSSGWYQDPATKKIHLRHENFDLREGPNAGRFEIMYGRATNGGLVMGSKLYIQDLIFRGDGQTDVMYETTFRPILFARNCTWQYLGYHNIQLAGARTLFQDCTSENSLNGDGWNYNDDSGTDQPCESIEIDCIGRYNGTPEYKSFDGDRNKQGSSGHDESVIARINGVYEGNHGQNIADTGIASISWMVGTICGSPWADLEPGGDGGYYNLWTEGTAWLDNVRAGGKASTYGLYVQSGLASLYRCQFTGTTAATFGTTVAFDPTE